MEGASLSQAEIAGKNNDTKKFNSKHLPSELATSQVRCGLDRRVDRLHRQGGIPVPGIPSREHSSNPLPYARSHTEPSKRGRSSRSSRKRTEWVPLLDKNALSRPLPPLEHQRTGHYAHARKRHRRASHHRMQTPTEGKEESHSKRNTEDVVHARPNEISFDCGEYLAGQVESRDDV